MSTLRARPFEGLRLWAGSHRLALVVALPLAVAGVVAVGLPPQERIFSLQRSLLAGVQMACGLLELPVIIAARVIGEALPPALALLANCLLFTGLGLLGGLLVEGLWRRGWPGRLLLLVGVVVNIMIGQFAITWGDTLVGPPSARCEKYFSETTGLRIVVYPEQGIIPGSHIFFSSTRDSGRTWRQFMHFRHDDPLEPDCEQSGSLTPDHFWAWYGWQAAVTLDAGRTWRLWQPADTWPDWRCCNYRLVLDITFSDSQNGQMRLDPIPAAAKRRSC